MEEDKDKQSKNNSFRKWVDLLVLYFTTIKEYEDKIESLRISLNQQNNFSVRALFNYLDKNSKNFISLDDFIKFLQDNSINYDEKHLRQFIHNYDKDNDFCINYQEFKGIVLPLTDDSFKKKKKKMKLKKKKMKQINSKKLKKIKKMKKKKKIMKTMKMKTMKKKKMRMKIMRTMKMKIIKMRMKKRKKIMKKKIMKMKK